MTGDTALHSVMLDPQSWKVARYEFELSDATGLPEYVLVTFRSERGATKKLMFKKPRIADFGNLRIPSSEHLLVADMSSLGWEPGQSVEVREWDDEPSVLFYAESVAEVS